MPSRFKLNLSQDQVEELRRLRKNHPKAYVRERAAAILKVGEGQSIRQVAQQGLLRRRKPHAVKEWINRYLEEGQDGLLIRKGRGRKPAFFPSEPGGSRTSH